MDPSAASIIVKCDPVEVRDGTIVVAEKPYEKVKVDVGNQAFIWTSEKRGGRGLAMRGLVRRVSCTDPKLELEIGIVDHTPASALGKRELEPLRNDHTTRLGRLPWKLYGYAHNKIASLTGDEAYALLQYFLPLASSQPAADVEMVTHDRALSDLGLIVHRSMHDE